MAEIDPFVSVVLAVYNGEALVSRCLKNLMESDYPAERYQIVIVDDSSTDNTVQLIHNLVERHQTGPKISLHRMDKRVGYYSCTNYGIKHSNCDVIILYAHDLFSERHWIRAMVDAFGSGSDVGGVYGRVVTDSRGFLPPLYYAPIGIYPLAYKRWVFDAVGFFDERFKSRGDSEFLYRVKNGGIGMALCDEPPVFHPLRKLSLRNLIDYGKRRQYDALLYAKERRRSKDERVLGGRLTGPIVGPFSPLGATAIGLTLAGMVLLPIYSGHLVGLVTILLRVYGLGLALIGGLLHLLFPDAEISPADRLRYIFWTPLFLLAVLLGRIYGSARWRTLLL